MGLTGLLQSSTGVISSLTNFGLGTSAVKNISAASVNADDKSAGKVINVFRKLVWLTGTLGALVTLLMAPYLSKVNFGNDNYIWAYVVLSGTLLINQIGLGYSVLMRGMRRVKLLAKASLFGSSLGLLVTIPLYYFYGLDGIVPGIVFTSVSTLVLNWYFSRKVILPKVSVSILESLIQGSEMLKMGFMISLNGFISLTFSYVVRVYISKNGSIEDVGLYSAGFTIINTYVGMVFTAMSTDYYPKLSSINASLSQLRNTINRQAEITLLILGPILTVFIVFIEKVVFLLYSEAFVQIAGMVIVAGAGVLFKALSWAIAFVLLAKGTSKLFFFNESITNVYMLTLNLLGYWYFGLIGLGLSFLIGYFIYTCQVYLLAKVYFQYSANKGLIQIFLVNGCAVFACLFLAIYTKGWLLYIIGTVVAMFSSIYSLYELNSRLGFYTKQRS
jgi:hypothetical protein